MSKITNFKQVFDMQDLRFDVELQEIILGASSELSEILQEIPWKWWKNYEGFEVDMDKVKEEIIDVGIFWILMCKSTGMDVQEVIDLIKTKSDFNLVREDHKR